VAGAARELGALEDITMTCLAKKPEERFASMDALIARIDRAVQLEGESDTDLGPRPSSERVSRSVRSAMPDEIELPTFEEMRVALDGARPSSPAGGRRPWRYLLYAGAVSGLVLGSFGVARWLVGREAPAGPAASPRMAPAPVPAPQAPSAELPPPPPSVAVSAAPSVGEHAPPPARPSSQASHRRAQVPGDLDDVGDPFKP
jgi:serine/threonine-protein kinase